MYKAILFDMDGTIVDTFDQIYLSFNKALADNGKRTLTKKEFDRELFGKPVESTITHLIGEVTPEELRKIMKDFELQWLQNLDKVKVFKSVPLTLERLKASGYKLGVVSTSPRSVVSETLRQTGIYKYFDVLICEEDAKHKKPHPEPVTNALNILKIKPEEAAFVGDTKYDIQAGKSAGCHTVFMLNDYNGDVLKEEKPDRVLRDVSELLENGES